MTRACIRLRQARHGNELVGEANSRGLSDRSGLSSRSRSRVSPGCRTHTQSYSIQICTHRSLGLPDDPQSDGESSVKGALLARMASIVETQRIEEGSTDRKMPLVSTLGIQSDGVE